MVVASVGATHDGEADQHVQEGHEGGQPEFVAVRVAMVDENETNLLCQFMQCPTILTNPRTGIRGTCPLAPSPTPPVQCIACLCGAICETGARTRVPCVCCGLFPYPSLPNTSHHHGHRDDIHVRFFEEEHVVQLGLLSWVGSWVDR